MLLGEAQARLKKTTITEEQLMQIHPIYCLLDFEKDDFCKLVDVLGIEAWASKVSTWERLCLAEEELTSKERYLKAKQRLEEIESEQLFLNEIITSFESAERSYK